MNTKKLIDKKIKIGNIFCNSSAQIMTAAGYGDTTGIAFRNLNYQAKCENYSDFIECLKIIGSYNEFDFLEIREDLEEYLSLKLFYNEKNINNGNDLFDFYIGRESSPVFYVRLFLMSGKKMIKNGEIIPYTEKDFEINMKILANLIKADEFTIDKTDWDIKARFWFD